jgi:predicted RNase H-like HicB family nuclease
MSTEIHPSFTVSPGKSTDLWVAKEEETGVVSQGETREKALENLDEALELYVESVPEELEVTEPSPPWFE